jgi:hypothetical protein
MHELCCLRIFPVLRGGFMKIEFPEQPVWEPLKAAVGERCREFMFMGKVGEIYLYKHVWTRRYLNIDGNGQAYQFTGDGYEPMPLNEAMEHAFA